LTTHIVMKGPVWLNKLGSWIT